MPPRPLRIVAIGAGLDDARALARLTARLPAGCAFAVVVAPQPGIDRARPHPLSAFLSRHAAMPVVAAADGAALEPGRIHLVEPGVVAAVAQGRFVHAAPGSRPGPPMPLDELMESVAAECGERAVGVLLARTGADGTLGLRAVQAHGGVTFGEAVAAGDRGEALRAAGALGCVDRWLPAERIGEALLPIAGGGWPDDAAVAAGDATAGPAADELPQRVARALGARGGVDVDALRPGIVRRRVARRRALLGLGDDDDGYLARLAADDDEALALGRDLLRRPAGFFRDARAFDVLQHAVLPRLTRRGEALRVWTPGCGSGEESYSVAICVAEHQARHAPQAPGAPGAPLALFATDVRDDALQTARAGRYPWGIVHEVAPDRLARFFDRERDGEGWKVKAAVRGACTFARQDVARDPPYPRLDLICCRGVLAGLAPWSQRQALDAFQFALRADGVLMLDAEEAAAAHAHGFAPLDVPGATLFTKRRPTVRRGARAGTAADTPREAAPAAVRGNGQPTAPNRVGGEDGAGARAEAAPGAGAGFGSGSGSGSDPAAAAGADGADATAGAGAGAGAAAAAASGVGAAASAHAADADAANDADAAAALDADADRPPGAAAPPLATQTLREELLAAHEELLSLNEDLTATNEMLRLRHRELQALHEDVARARGFADAIVQTTSQPMLVLDDALRVLRANAAFHEAFATTAQQTLQRPLYALGDGHWRTPAVRRLFDERLPGGPVRRHEATLESPAFGRRCVLLNASRVETAGAAATLLTIEDVTDQRAALGALAEANRQKDRFLAVLAHELRNPLAGMSNALHLLQHPAADAAQKSAALGMLSRQLGNQVRMVDELLDVSRISRGLVQLRRSRIDLARVVRLACDGLKARVDARAHALRLDLPPGPVEVDGDPVRLEQVVANLVANAAKYTPPRGHIDVRLARDGADVVLTVADDGIGIAAELLPRVFEPFVRGADSTRMDVGGLGLGLSIVRRIVELHGGSVHAESDGASRGSRFAVRLRAVAAADAPATAEPAAGTAPPVAATTARRVLLVDDDEDAGRSLGALLALEGLSVRVVHDGAKALDEARVLRPDAAVVDLAMPGLDGYTVCRRLRAMPELDAMPIIVVSGFGQSADIAAAHEAGADHFLTKPADPLRIAELASRGRAAAAPAPVAAATAAEVNGPT